MYRSLMEDVSISELLRMRDEEGVSNREIADALGVSYSCIKKYIGCQPKGMRKVRSKGVVYGRGKSEEAPAEEIPPCLVIRNRTVTAAGIDMEYIIDYELQTVRMHKPSRSNIFWMFTFDELANALPELQAISRRASECRVTPEMW